MLFVTHHKCASTLSGRYVKQLCLDNNLTFYGTPRGNRPPSPDHDVNFLSNASYPFLNEHVTRRAIHIIRNPLNVAQSAYYSHLRSHPVKKTLPMLVTQRRVLEQCSPEEGKMLTVVFCERNDFFHLTPGPLCGLRQWDYDDNRFTTVRMEDYGDRIDLALSRAAAEQGADLTWPDAGAFTFKAMSGGRAPGMVDENSPYRSGHPDAWRTELPRGVIIYIREHFRPLLERFYPDSLVD